MLGACDSGIRHVSQSAESTARACSRIPTPAEVARVRQLDSPERAGAHSYVWWHLSSTPEELPHANRPHESGDDAASADVLGVIARVMRCGDDDRIEHR